MRKRSQASLINAKDKEATDLESLTHTIKYLSNELAELKQMSSKTNVSSKPPKFNLLKMATSYSRNNNQPSNYAQRSNIMLNF